MTCPLLLLRPLLRLLLLAAALAAPGLAGARGFQGEVTHVTDGDSLWVRPEAGGTPRAVRLQGIDAPEICQPFGREARDALAARVLHRRVTVQPRARDRYERLLARVSAGSDDLGGWLVARGYAWSDGYRGGGPYARQQAHAMAQRLGLWHGGGAQRPRDFRRRHGSCTPHRGASRRYHCPMPAPSTCPP
ncbi:thermonuclease family protein [Ramlibacter sp.]|uniref:thermonuclease family protein n=1 Tax=Ramlibacter sp. TaxID=1917967 RepID=UPI002D15F5FE|nr:thermonuclease family protein [Ramlibacter sp.]HWI82924.1 thermonuclease family protein [Ramlibacter sp.]